MWAMNQQRAEKMQVSLTGRDEQFCWGARICQDREVKTWSQPKQQQPAAPGQLTAQTDEYRDPKNVTFGLA